MQKMEFMRKYIIHHPGNAVIQGEQLVNIWTGYTN